MAQYIEPKILSMYKIIKKIGSGSYGHVYQVIDLKNNRTKALKKNFDAFQNSTDAQRTYREIMFLMELKHPNIITLEEVIPAENGRDIYLVFEFMDADLHMLVHHNLLSEDHIKYVLYQVARAVFFMHSAGLIHRDLKPSNVLVNESCEAKLADFGLVRSVSQRRGEKEDILTDYIATRWYRAPENILGSKVYSYEIDVWSFGCLAAQLYRGSPLFSGTSTLNQLQKIMMWTGQPSEQTIDSIKIKQPKKFLLNLLKVKPINKKQLFPYINQQCLDLITMCLQFDPKKRINFEQIILHKYFSQLHENQQLIRSPKTIKLPIQDHIRLESKQYLHLIISYIKSKFKQKKNYQKPQKILIRTYKYQFQNKQLPRKQKRRYNYSCPLIRPVQPINNERQIKDYKTINVKHSKTQANNVQKQSNRRRSIQKLISTPKKHSNTYSLIQKTDQLQIQNQYSDFKIRNAVVATEQSQKVYKQFIDIREITKNQKISKSSALKHNLKVLAQEKAKQRRKKNSVKQFISVLPEKRIQHIDRHLKNQAVIFKRHKRLSSQTHKNQQYQRQDQLLTLKKRHSQFVNNSYIV